MQKLSGPILLFYSRQSLVISVATFKHIYLVNRRPLGLMKISERWDGKDSAGEFRSHIVGH